MGYKRPSSIQMFLLFVAVLVAGCGSWKWYQDVDDIAYARTQIQKERVTVVESPAHLLVETRVRAAAHGDTLLAITREERILREMEAQGANDSSLRDAIERDLARLLSVKRVVPRPPLGSDTTNAVEFYTRWECDARQAITLDLSIIGASISCAACIAWMWFRLRILNQLTG